MFGKRRVQGVLAIFVAGTGYALMSILVKEAFQLGLGPLQAIVLQSWLSSLLLFCYAVLFKREIFKIAWPVLGLLVIQGIAGTLGTSLLYAYSLRFLPVSVAILLLYLYPAMVLAAGVIIWHKKISRREILALFLTLAGTILASGIFSGVSGIVWLGIFLGLAGALAYASFNIIGEFVLAKISPLAAMCYSQWVCALALLVILKGDVLSIPWQDAQTWKIGFLLATVASILPFYMILVGIGYLGSDKAAILSTFELPMTFFLAAVFLKEFPTKTQWAGGALVLAGIILLEWGSQSEQSNEEAFYKERTD